MMLPPGLQIKLWRPVTLIFDLLQWGHQDFAPEGGGTECVFMKYHVEIT